MIALHRRRFSGVQNLRVAKPVAIKHAATKIPHWFGIFKPSQRNTESPAVSGCSCSAFFFHLLYNHNTVSQHIPLVSHSLAYWQVSLYPNASAQRKTRSKSHYHWSLIEIHLEAAAISRVCRHSLIMKCQGKKKAAPLVRELSTWCTLARIIHLTGHRRTFLTLATRRTWTLSGKQDWEALTCDTEEEGADGESRADIDILLILPWQQTIKLSDCFCTAAKQVPGGWTCYVHECACCMSRTDMQLWLLVLLPLDWAAHDCAECNTKPWDAMAASNHYYTTRTLQRYWPQELWLLVGCLASITVCSRILNP